MSSSSPLGPAVILSSGVAAATACATTSACRWCGRSSTRSSAKAGCRFRTAPTAGVKLECRDPSVHVNGLHGRECHAAQHVVECRENQAGVDGPSLSPPDETITYEGPASTNSPTPASQGSEEPQEGAAGTEPPPRQRRKARNAATAAASAVLVAGSTVPGWSSILEVQLAMLAAAAVILVQARRNWREGTELKQQGQQTRAESQLRSEINRHVSRLVADATAANDAIKGFDEAIEQSDQRDPVRDKMASATRRALVEEARARVTSPTPEGVGFLRGMPQEL